MMAVKLSREATSEMVRLLYLWIDELQFSQRSNDEEVEAKPRTKTTDQNVSYYDGGDEPSS